MSVDWYDKCQSAEADLLLARAEIERLRALVLVAQPDMERLEACEASADDGCGTRLQTLRQWVINARRALEEK